MIKWIKNKLGIKDVKTCLKCELLFEPNPKEDMMFNCWCSEHRKPYLEQRDLERWAKDWAAREPEEAKKIKSADDMKRNKINSNYAQQLGAMMQSQQSQNALNGNLGMQKNWPFGGIIG